MHSNHLRARSERPTEPDNLPEGITWSELDIIHKALYGNPAGHEIADYLQLNPDIKDKEFEKAWPNSKYSDQVELINDILDMYNNEGEKTEMEEIENMFNETFKIQLKDFLSNDKTKKAEKREFNDLFFWHYLTNMQQEPRKRKRYSSPRKRKRKRRYSPRKRSYSPRKRSASPRKRSYSPRKRSASSRKRKRS
eukprot:Pgem_evm1s3591